MTAIKYLICLSALYCSSIQANVNSYFNQINKDPNALYAFFKIMPKGGELHYHLAGGAYPESLLEMATTGDYCIDKRTFTAAKGSLTCAGVKSNELIQHPDFYAAIVKSWSLKDFKAGSESAFDHFFNSFNKYITLISDYGPKALTSVINRAAEQKENYLEVMILPDNGNSLQFASSIANINSFNAKKDNLLENRAFQTNINTAALEPERILKQTQEELQCTNRPFSPACNVKVRFQTYVLREQNLDSVFAQTLTAFEIASRSKGLVVGVNLVQRENEALSLRDYRVQMEIFNYFHTLYPNVNIALHAGELAPESVIPEALGYHIHDAVFTGHAKRIGHGVDIAYENNQKSTLNYMAKHQIPVEINLISNKQILGISGHQHPLNYYLAHNVPVTLSTDDEGILRTDLTRQYVEAVLAHGLDYSTLKQINRNALTYAFLPGKSIWADPIKAKLIDECQDINSSSCLEFIQGDEKARLQWQLERQLLEFENGFD